MFVFIEQREARDNLSALLRLILIHCNSIVASKKLGQSHRAQATLSSKVFNFTRILPERCRINLSRLGVEIVQQGYHAQMLEHWNNG